MDQNQWLMPLTASIACVEAGLSADESVALTAAALVLNGPMAIAPTLVAIERSRQDAATGDNGVGTRDKNEKGTTKSAPVKDIPPEKIGPALVSVPKLGGLDLEEALDTLGELNLRYTVAYNHSTEAKKGKVLMQQPRPAPGALIEEGTKVNLFIGAGPVEAAPETEEEAIDEVKKGVGTLKNDVDRRFDGLDARLERLELAIVEFIALRSGDSQG